MWQTILKAAIQTSGPAGASTFTRAEVLAEAARLDASHPSHSYSAMFQTMVIEAPGRSMAPVGKVFQRLDRSTYLVVWDALPERWKMGRATLTSAALWRPPGSTTVEGNVAGVMSMWASPPANWPPTPLG